MFCAWRNVIKKFKCKKLKQHENKFVNSTESSFAWFLSFCKKVVFFICLVIQKIVKRAQQLKNRLFHVWKTCYSTRVSGGRRRSRR